MWILGYYTEKIVVCQSFLRVVSYHELVSEILSCSIGGKGRRILIKIEGRGMEASPNTFAFMRDALQFRFNVIPKHGQLFAHLVL